MSEHEHTWTPAREMAAYECACGVMGHKSAKTGVVKVVTTMKPEPKMRGSWNWNHAHGCRRMPAMGAMGSNSEDSSAANNGGYLFHWWRR